MFQLSHWLKVSAAGPLSRLQVSWQKSLLALRAKPLRSDQLRSLPSGDESRSSRPEEGIQK